MIAPTLKDTARIVTGLVTIVFFWPIIILLSMPVIFMIALYLSTNLLRSYIIWLTSSDKWRYYGWINSPGDKLEAIIYMVYLYFLVTSLAIGQYMINEHSILGVIIAGIAGYYRCLGLSM